MDDCRTLHQPIVGGQPMAAHMFVQAGMQERQAGAELIADRVRGDAPQS